MWLRNVFLKSLRDYRVPVLGWGIGMGLVVVSPMASLAALISTPQAREQLAALAASYAWNADVVAVDTVGGYATWKIGIFVLLVVIWPILAASRMLRGEEESGSLDVVLSLPHSRVVVGLQKVAAMWVALLAMGVIIGLIADAGGAKFGADFGLAHGLLFGFNLALICMVFGSLTLLISQFTAARNHAAGWAAGLLLVSIVVDMVHRIFAGTDWISRISPVYYFNLSKPLVPSHAADAGATLVLIVLTVVLSGAAIWLFAGRDVGAPVPLPLWMRLPVLREPSISLPVQEWSLRSVYTRSLRTVAFPALWWTLGIAGFAGWMVVAVQQLESRLNSLFSGASAARDFFRNIGGGDVTVAAGFLSAMFVILPLLLMAFAVTQVNRWANDEQEGRLEMVLATPQSRLRVLMGRFAALATATIAIGVVTMLVTVVAAVSSGLTVDGGNVAAATLGAIPMGLLIAAIGYLASGWLQTAADTGLLSFVLAAWFFISFIGPDLKWPDATLRLSPFYYYGTPLLHGLQAADMAGLIAAGALALGLGALRFVRKDIGV
jgi:polyether ionophore transport system permease protein